MTPIKVCVKCGAANAGDGIYMRASRSTEWHITELAQIDEEYNKTMTTRLYRADFCEHCLNQIESLLYNWWHGLSLNHRPFQPW
jgi:hypothetical protein